MYLLPVETGFCEREGTEYFARGARPSQTYVMRDAAVVLQQAMTDRRDGESVPPPPSIASMPSSPAAAAQTVSADIPPSAAEATADGETPKKKRGFWGKVFGKK